MEQTKRKRGRSKIDAGIADPLGIGCRASVNTKYMYDGVGLLLDAASDIPERDLLWHLDSATHALKSKNGILEQLGRMVTQDHLAFEDCVLAANQAIEALKHGYTSRRIEIVLREIRMAIKRYRANPDNQDLQHKVELAFLRLVRMR